MCYVCYLILDPLPCGVVTLFREFRLETGLPGLLTKVEKKRHHKDFRGRTWELANMNGKGQADRLKKDPEFVLLEAFGDRIDIGLDRLQANLTGPSRQIDEV